MIAYMMTASEDDQGKTRVNLNCLRFAELSGYEQDYAGACAKSHDAPVDDARSR